MAHTIERDGPGDMQKFVTIRNRSGEYRTRIHAYNGHMTPHLQLIAELLKEEGILGGFEAPDYRQVKAAEEFCMGGGAIEGEDVLWGSSGLRVRIGRDKPGEKDLADQLIGDVRTWVKRTLEVELGS